MTETDPIYSPGPYENPDQALRQFANSTSGIPGDTGYLIAMTLDSGYLRGGVTPSEFERRYLATTVEDPLTAQLITGMLQRAFFAGRDKAVDDIATRAADEFNADKIAQHRRVSRQHRLTLTEDDIAARSSEVE
jgi:hypothetical protein